MKKICLSHYNFSIHSFTKLMIENPPKGYIFLFPPSTRLKKGFRKFILNSGILKFIYKTIIKKFFNTFSLYQNIYSSNPPIECDLLYSPIPLIINKKYILEILDHPAAMTGYDYNVFIKSIADIEKKLLSSYCKKIIVVNESSYQLMKKYFGPKVIKKTQLIRAGILKQTYKKNYNKNKLQILFIGSLTNPNDFYIKGGLEALESFKRISDKFDNVNMIMKCKVPKNIKKRYFSIKNLEILEDTIPSDKWVNIMKNSDILLQPGHVYPLMATLESMSYSIPIIMLDTWGVRDYLENNKNSILIKPSSKITEYNSKEYPLNIRSKKFISQIKNIDERVINNICSVLEKMINNPRLRERLGKTGKKIAETKFSFERRNKILKRIFDEAINQ